MIDDGRKNDQNQNQTDQNQGTMDEGSLGGQASRGNQNPSSATDIGTDTGANEESSDIE